MHRFFLDAKMPLTTAQVPIGIFLYSRGTVAFSGGQIILDINESKERIHGLLPAWPGFQTVWNGYELAHEYGEKLL